MHEAEADDRHDRRAVPAPLVVQTSIAMPPSSVELVTVGHGTLSHDDLAALLCEAAVGSLVDIRTAPGSRRHPHVGRAELEVWVPAVGIGYHWEQRLGGFRKALPGSLNMALRHPSFRGYADFMRTPPFWGALDEVLATAASKRTAVMCSETLWWRCHRRLLADAAVLARGVDVRHLGHDGRLSEHRITEGARLGDDGLPIYDVGETVWLPGV